MSKQYRYAELHAHNAFTFLESADSPEELVRSATELGLSGLGVLDVDGMYSAVQTASAGRKYGMPIVHGVELTIDHFEIPDSSSLNPLRRAPKSDSGGVFLRSGDGLPAGSMDPGIRLPVLATSQIGYHALCSLLSTHFLEEPGRRKVALRLEEIETLQRSWESPDLLALTGTSRGPLQRAIRTHGLKSGRAVLERLKEVFGQDGVAVEMNAAPHEPPERDDQLALLAHEANLPLVATGAVRSSDPSRTQIADVLGAIRLGKSLEQAEPHLPAWRSFMRSPKEMSHLFIRHPAAVDNAVAIAESCAFDLRIIDPGLPNFPVPEGKNEAQWLRELTYQGAQRRYGSRRNQPDAWNLIDHELAIIEQLGFPGYFLIVKDIVDFCSSQEILCQGRGSAANSAVCYALGITAVDAVKHKMLFERFMSPDRKEAPDIDLDIEAGEREVVIQYVYQKYGRENAAQVANVVSYRPKSAVRDAGKALGYPEGAIRRWSQFVNRRNHDSKTSPANSEIPDEVLQISQNLQRLPRHMGLHPGGMVLTHKPVSQVCPVMWAAKEDRSVLQWGKEDCADAGLVKFDLLGLGMLTALRRIYNWLAEQGITWNGRPLELHSMPDDDPRVYDLLCAADTVGVFQVESRAQMNTLPRLKPRNFYDIVIEVALIRPGPIQGRAVNPYLRRKNGKEQEQSLHSLLEPALHRTLGVPLFQEQLMQMAVDIAGFTPGQADELRRAIGSKRSDERMLALRPALYEGMTRNGVAKDVQEQIFDQLKGFAEFGFPESHAFSFAYLVYASSWLKVHYPEFFYAGLLASQPMGFYSPASLVEDARRHGVSVLPPCVVNSEVKTRPVRVGVDTNPANRSRKEGVKKLVDADPTMAVRIGLETVSGIGKAAERIIEARSHAPFDSLQDMASRAKLSPTQLEKLAAAGALEALGSGRREGLWKAGVVGQTQWEQPHIPGTEPGANTPVLPPVTEAERVLLDYRTLGLSTENHPIALVRDRLKTRGVEPLSALPRIANGQKILIAGVVTHRQRPATARGTTFLSIEDETGLANIICSPGLWARYKKTALESTALVIRGHVEQGDGATAVVADRLEALLIPVRTRSRDFQ
ncbi:error-prone DNA polymerase [Actinomycetaceae bacterium MB13-C1-2]|nr:error-prone DNA polymerase [Actinomycetaceae bacterium MB13-C1-2]